MRILLYTRPNTEVFLRNLARAVDESCEMYEISDFRGHGDAWAGKYLNGNEKKVFFDKNEHENIRLRCRFLRSIEREKAYDLIDKYAFFVINIFNDFKPELVLSQLPDNYCMDIIQRIAVKQKVFLASMVETFLIGYSRLTLRGERIDIRESSRDEAERVTKELLDKTYKPYYLDRAGNTYFKHIYYVGRRKLIETFYYPLKKMVEHDRWNYHYNTLYYRRMRISDVVNRKVEKLFKHVEDICIDDTCVYVPLHCSPEATVDYYGDDPKYALYEEFMYDIAETAEKGIRLLIKEHPAMYGMRNARFYEKMASLKNVTLIHPYDNSNEILNKCKYVLVFSGSVGVEAVIRNKVIFTLTSNYYSDLSPNIYKVKKLTNDLLKIDYADYDGVKFMQDVLNGFMYAKQGPQSNMKDSDTEAMGMYIRKNYENHAEQHLN